MTTTNSPMIDFLYKKEHTNQVIDPVAAARDFPHLLQNNNIPNDLAESAQKDTKVTDAVTYGWYVFQPTQVTITEDTTNDNMNLTITEGEHLVTEIDGPSQEFWTGTINTLWYITVPTDHVLLVTNPLYNPNGPVISQVFRDSDSPHQLTIPILTDTALTLHSEHPIAQVIPISTDVIDTDNDVIGVQPDEIKSQLKKQDQLTKIFNNLYRERIWTRKPSPPPLE